MSFTNEFKLYYSPLVCPKHGYLLQYSFYPSPSKIPMPSSKVDNDLEDTDNLEEPRYLTFKEIVGIREVRDTLSGYTNSSYSYPLKL